MRSTNMTRIKNLNKTYIILGAMCILYAVMQLHLFMQIPSTFWGDTNDYYAIAQQDVLSLEFWTASRPALFPLIMKVFNSDQETVTYFQLIASITSWYILGISIFVALKDSRIRWLGLVSILLMSFSTQIFVWHSIMLTDSLSNSLTILTLALWLFFLNRIQSGAPLKFSEKFLYTSAILLSSTLFTLIRDSNPYILIAIVSFIIFINVIYRKQARHLLGVWVILCVGMTALFMLQSYSATEGGRWRGPVGNEYVHNIFPDAETRAFFIERGMPADEEMMAFYRQFETNQPLDQIDSKFPVPLENWFSNHGRSTYLEYLRLHPSMSLWTPIQAWEVLLTVDQTYALRYARVSEISNFHSTIDQIFFEPRGFWLISILLSAFGLMGLTTWERRLTQTWLAPIFLLLVLYPFIFMVWHSDPNDIQRHAIGASIVARISVMIVLLLGIDMLFSREQKHNQFNTQRLKTALAAFMTLCIFLQLIFAIPWFQRNVLLNVYAPEGNWLYPWYVGENYYAAYRDDVLQFIQSDKQIIQPYIPSNPTTRYSGSRGIITETNPTQASLIEDGWQWQDSKKLPLSEDRIAIDKWVGTFSPSFIAETDIGYVYIDDDYWSLLSDNARNNLTNVNMYELANSWEDENSFRRLYRIVNTTQDTDTNEQLGLNDRDYALYLEHTESYDLLPTEAKIFNPVTSSLDWYDSTRSLGRYISEQDSLSPAEKTELFDLLVTWQQTQHQDNLDLNESQSAILSCWRNTKSSDALLALGYDYLLVSDLWWDFLTQSESNFLLFSGQYHQITEWRGIVPGFYRLLKAMPDDGLLSECD